MQISNVFSALAGAERVFAVMDEKPEPAEDPDAVELNSMEGHVVLENVTFGYHPDKTILKNISLYAKPGQKIAFVGSTGAGKTTITVRDEYKQKGKKKKKPKNFKKNGKCQE